MIFESSTSDFAGIWYMRLATYVVIVSVGIISVLLYLQETMLKNYKILEYISLYFINSSSAEGHALKN